MESLHERWWARPGKCSERLFSRPEVIIHFLLKLQRASHKRSYPALDLFNDFMMDLVTMTSDVTVSVDPTQVPKDVKIKKGEAIEIFIHQQSPKPSGDHCIADCTEFKKNGLGLTLEDYASKRTLLNLPDSSSNMAVWFQTVQYSRFQLPAFLSASSHISFFRHTLIHTFPSRCMGTSTAYQAVCVSIWWFFVNHHIDTHPSWCRREGPNESLSLKKTGDVTRIETDSQRIAVTISGTSEDRPFPLKAKTVGPLKLPS